MVKYIGSSVDEQGAKEMIDFASDLCGADPPFQCALEVIRVQDERDEVEGRRPPFDVIAAELYGTESNEMRREILRLGVLFANIHACANSQFNGLVKRDVFLRLGISEEGHTYNGWFGKRSSSGIISSRTLKVAPLEFYRNTGDVDSCFIKWGISELSAEDRIRIHHYLESFAQSEGYVVPASLSYLSSADDPSSRG